MTESTEPTEKTLEALYNINKHARKYANLGTKNYNNGKKATAKTNSVKKTALYTTKTRTLERIQEQATNIVVHIINERKYYCLFFEGEQEWSFHSPMDEFTLMDSIEVVDEEELDNFTKTAAKDYSSMSLKESLLHIETQFCINANNHLPQEYVSYGHQSYFSGWPYLGQTHSDSDTTQTTIS